MQTLVLSKDGQEYEIENGPGVLEKARAKGYQVFVPMEKAGEAVDVEYDAAQAALNKGYSFLGNEKLLADQRAIKDKPSVLTSTLAAASQGLNPFMDEIQGGINAAAGAAAKGTLSDLAADYQAGRDEDRARNTMLEEANPTPYKIANLTGGVAQGIVTGGAGLAPAIISGAANAFGGAEGDAGSQIFQTGLGGLLGAAGKYAGDAIGGISKAGFEAGKRFFADQALDATMRNQLKLGESGMKNQVLDAVANTSKFGMSRDELAGKMAEELNSAGQIMGKFHQQADEAGAQIDLAPIANQVETMVPGFVGPKQPSSLPIYEGPREAAASEMQKWSQSYVNNKPVRTTAETQDLMNELTDYAKYDTQGAPTTQAVAARDLRSMYGLAKDKAIEDTLGGDALKEYLAAKNKFGIYKQGENLMNQAAARQNKQGAFSLKDQILGKSVQGEGGPIKDAIISAGIKQIRSRLGTSGAATMRQLENWASKMPSGSEKPRQIIETLTRALTKSPEAFNSAFYLLQKQDPEFRQGLQNENP